MTTDLNSLLKAINFAAEKHKNQRRKDGRKDSNGNILVQPTPYINHPIGVAYLLSSIGNVTDVKVLQAAALHDTIEDTGTKYEELVEHFGSSVADIVMEVTDDKSLPKSERKKHQVEHAPHISKEAKLVKLADKLYNLRDLIRCPPESWDVKRVQGYFVWAKKVISGIRGTNAALEEELDRVFKQEFVYSDSKSYPVIPSGDLDAFLEEYYASLKDQD